MEIYLPAIAAITFFAWGVASDRLASTWPEASGRAPGTRTALLGLGAAAAAGAIAWRSEQPLWVTGVYLAFLAMLVLLTATDLEGRLLPHAVLDPLIIGAAVFVPFNPAVEWQSAAGGALAAVTFLGVLGLLMPGGIARGDLFLVAPIGLLLGLPGVFGAMLIAALLAGLTSIALLVTGRVGLKSYIPFGPFLVGGAVITLVQGPELLARASILAGMP